MASGIGITGTRSDVAKKLLTEGMERGAQRSLFRSASLSDRQ